MNFTTYQPLHSKLIFTIFITSSWINVLFFRIVTDIYIVYTREITCKQKLDSVYLFAYINEAIFWAFFVHMWWNGGGLKVLTMAKVRSQLSNAVIWRATRINLLCVKISYTPVLNELAIHSTRVSFMSTSDSEKPSGKYDKNDNTVRGGDVEIHVQERMALFKQLRLGTYAQVNGFRTANHASLPFFFVFLTDIKNESRRTLLDNLACVTHVRSLRHAEINPLP